MNMIDQEKILILDFGSQYTNLIARRIRELHCYSEILPFNVDPEKIRKLNPRGIILSGSHGSVEKDGTYRAPDIIFDLGIPILGICYGMQTLAHQTGGHIISSRAGEFGSTTLHYETDSSLFKGLDNSQELTVWMSHFDQVQTVPPGFRITARSEGCPIAAMEDPVRRLYGLQFHPEVSHTQGGEIILGNFVRDICGCRGLWSPSAIIEESIADIRRQVGEETVVLALSGGVDSSVVAALLRKAIGGQLSCIFVDSGLLRQGESEQVYETFSALGYNITLVKAEEKFLTALSGVTDPETKRKIIGKTFIDIFDESAPKHVTWLAQGTIYPDIIESAGNGTSTVIKSHHNVGGLPERMRLKLIEPIRYLFKDEVKTIGRELGLPSEILHRHPFPGPGLSIRILGEIQKEYIQILRQADTIFMDILKEQGWYTKVNQAFSVFLPIKSVGVMGDSRTYDWVIALRAVETVDFMTARWAHLPHDLLATVSQRIINTIPGVNRVVYDISDKPPATIEWE